MCSGEVLGERREVGIGVRIDIARPLGDPAREVLVIAPRLDTVVIPRCAKIRSDWVPTQISLPYQVAVKP